MTADKVAAAVAGPAPRRSMGSKGAAYISPIADDSALNGTGSNSNGKQQPRFKLQHATGARVLKGEVSFCARMRMLRCTTWEAARPHQASALPSAACRWRELSAWHVLVNSSHLCFAGAIACVHAGRALHRAVAIGNRGKRSAIACTS